MVGAGQLKYFSNTYYKFTAAVRTEATDVSQIMRAQDDFAKILKTFFGFQGADSA